MQILTNVMKVTSVPFGIQFHLSSICPILGSTDLKNNQWGSKSVHFYVPTIKWLRHIVLTHSVIHSFCHSIIIYFPIIMSTTIIHMKFKYNILMYLINIQAEFEFSFGLMIFDKVMHLELKRK